MRRKTLALCNNLTNHFWLYGTGRAGNPLLCVAPVLCCTPANTQTLVTKKEKKMLPPGHTSSCMPHAIKMKLKWKMRSVEKKSTIPSLSKLPKVSKKVFKWHFELANFQILKSACRIIPSIYSKARVNQWISCSLNHSSIEPRWSNGLKRHIDMPGNKLYSLWKAFMHIFFWLYFAFSFT